MGKGPSKRLPATVYVILDERGKPRYVGQTTDMVRRTRDHDGIRRLPGPWPSNPLNTWLKSLNGAPTIKVLQRGIPWEKRHEVEEYWTTVLRQGGADLLNQDTGAKHSSRTVEKLRDIGRRVMSDPIIGERHSEAMRRHSERRRTPPGGAI